MPSATLTSTGEEPVGVKPRRTAAPHSNAGSAAAVRFLGMHDGGLDGPLR
jgi:hypothetical protein